MDEQKFEIYVIKGMELEDWRILSLRDVIHDTVLLVVDGELVMICHGRGNDFLAGGAKISEKQDNQNSKYNFMQYVRGVVNKFWA